MAKEKQLLKVVGTLITGVNGSRLETSVGRGIVSLGRGQTAVSFIHDFLRERGVVMCTINQRGDNTWSTTPIMFLMSEPKLVISYVFTQFSLSEINYYGKDLTKEELIRDFKILKKILK